jgi:hypothetical protein
MAPTGGAASSYQLRAPGAAELSGWPETLTDRVNVMICFCMHSTCVDLFVDLK